VKEKRKKRSFTSEAAFADDTPPPRLRDERKMKKSPFFLLPLSAIAEGEKNRPMERQKARGLRHERSGLAKDRRTDELSEEFLTRRRRSFSCQARYSNQLLHLLSRSPALAGALPLFFSPFTHTHTHTFCSCYGLLNSQIYLAPFFFFLLCWNSTVCSFMLQPLQRVEATEQYSRRKFDTAFEQCTHSLSLTLSYVYGVAFRDRT